MSCENCTCDGLKIGDVVKLKSGGPKMVVQAVSSSNVSCQYFTGSVDVGNVCFNTANIGSEKCLELVKD
jgi:uncharacterized protein YodC (DUF2158 family)